MKRAKVRTQTTATYATVAVVAAFTAVGLAAPASADYVFMECVANGDPLQDCDGGVLTRALPTTGQPFAWKVSYTSSTDMCSDIIMRIRSVSTRGGITELGRTRIGPGQSTPVYEIPNRKGSAVELHATGVEGGCNTGTLTAWEGDLQIERLFGGLPG